MDKEASNADYMDDGYAAYPPPYSTQYATASNVAPAHGYPQYPSGSTAATTQGSAQGYPQYPTGSIAATTKGSPAQGYPQYPAGSTASAPVHGYPSTQYPATTVVTQQPYNVVTIVQQPQPVSSSQSVCYLVWSILSCLFCFWPLGLTAIVFSSLAVNAACSGQGERARSNGNIALWLNVAADIIGIVCLVVFIVIVVNN